VKASRRGLFAVVLAASMLSACANNGSTDGDQDATDRPTSIPTATVEPSVAPSPSPGTTSPSPGTTSPSPGITSPSPGATSPRAGRLCDTKVESANPALRNVRFGRHATYDRLAFDFCQPADTTLDATVVKELREDGSGNRVTLKGKYFIEITLTPADAHSDTGQPTVPRQAVTVAGRNMQQYKLIGDFEGVVTYGVGVMRLEETATALRADPNDPRHIVLYFDLGPQRG
jgi:hypothetical protein